MVPIHIRLATSQDLPHIPGLEVAASQIFRSVGMDAIADDTPPSLESLEEYRQAGHIWVAISQLSTESAGGSERLAGYVLVHLLREQSASDLSVHIQQVTVAPGFTRQRIGAKLIQHVELWARDQGFRELSLTTFRDVPWNAPYYRRLGFHDVDDEELQREKNATLNDIVATETGIEVLARWPRTPMKMTLIAQDK